MKHLGDTIILGGLGTWAAVAGWKSLGTQRQEQVITFLDRVAVVIEQASSAWKSLFRSGPPGQRGGSVHCGTRGRPFRTDHAQKHHLADRHPGDFLVDRS